MARSACCSLLVVFLLLAVVRLSAGDNPDAIQASQQVPAPAEPDPEWYFWNEITGETQWEDPGDVPFEDEEGRKFWLSETGERVIFDTNAHKYSWVENWSDEHKRPFYYNQKTKESTWEKPVDMAWRRVRVKDEL